MPDSTLSSYRTVIRAIDSTWGDGTAFALWELRKATGLSNSTVIRCVRRLLSLNLLVRARRRAYANRHYRVHPRWRGAEAVIQTYEYAKVLRI